jgi:hypothetical protein
LEIYRLSIVVSFDFIAGIERYSKMKPYGQEGFGDSPRSRAEHPVFNTGPAEAGAGMAENILFRLFTRPSNLEVGRNN